MKKKVMILGFVSLACMIAFLSVLYTPVKSSGINEYAKDALDEITPTPTPTSLLWMGDVETCDLSQWTANNRGGCVTLGGGSSCSVVTPPAPVHSGQCAAALTIDTNGCGDSHAAWLFLWDEDILAGDNYYSAWFYIPTNTQPADWWSIWQWKSDIDGNSDHSIRNFSIGVRQDGSELELDLSRRRDPNDDPENNFTYTQTIKNVVPGTWFQIKAYYKKAVDESGQVIVWQDNTEIFNIQNVKTIFDNGTPDNPDDDRLYWSVNSSAGELTLEPATIYVDDARVDSVDPQPSETPTFTPTYTPTDTPTPTDTATPTPTNTDTPTETFTPTFTPTFTSTPTATTSTTALLPGVYDDTDTRITYTGNWTPSTLTGMYNNTYHYSQDISNTASFTIYGGGFKLIYYKQTNYGTAKVWIDGVDIGTINMAGSSLTTQLQWDSPVYTPGYHNVVIEHTSGWIIDLDGIIVIDALQPGTYDDTDINILYGGTWGSNLSYAGMYNNSYHYSTSINDTTAAFFNGRVVKLIYYNQVGYGTATIRIDGVDVDTINMAGSSLQMKLQWSSPILSEGFHTITLVHTSGAIIDLDGISVFNPLSPGTYDDTNMNISYGGIWGFSSPYSGMFGNTYHYSQNINNTSTVYFKGQSIKLIYYKQVGYGTATVRIDGEDIGTINMADSSLQMQMQWSSPALTEDVHSFTLVHTSGAFIDIDGIIVAGSSPTPTPVTTGTYDDTDANIIYNGGWTADTLSGMYNDTYHYSEEIGDTTSLTFTGHYIYLVYYKQVGYGTVTIQIDGKDVDTINMAGSSLQMQLKWISPIQTSGVHSITLLHSSGGIVDLDAFIIPELAPPGIYDDPNTNIIYSGDWTASTYSGMSNDTYHYSQVTGNTASFLFNGQGVKLIYYKQVGYGTATIRIDGVDITTINMANSSIQLQLQWDSGTLTSGVHKITLVHTSGTFIDLDGFIVY